MTLLHVYCECNGKFVLRHSIHGRIRIKRTFERVDKKEENDGIGDWISISSPDELFQHGLDDIDFGKYYYRLLFNDENGSDDEWLVTG